MNRGAKSVFEVRRNQLFPSFSLSPRSGRRRRCDFSSAKRFFLSPLLLLLLLLCFARVNIWMRECSCFTLIDDAKDCVESLCHEHCICNQGEERRREGKMERPFNGCLVHGQEGRDQKREERDWPSHMPTFSSGSLKSYLPILLAVYCLTCNEVLMACGLPFAMTPNVSCLMPITIFCLLIFSSSPFSISLCLPQ